MKKLTLEEIEKFIIENKGDIHSLDEKELPMVLADLQGEQARIDGIEDHRKVTEIGQVAFANVFPCYSEINYAVVDFLFI